MEYDVGSAREVLRRTPEVLRALRGEDDD